MSQPKPYLVSLSRKHPGKRAFITGAGNGLGLAFAMELAAAGWTIGITDLNKDSLNAAAQMIQNSGGTPVPYLFDVTDYDKFRDSVNNFQQLHGGIDIGINNAGIGCGGFIHELPIESYRKVIEVNLMGVINGCHLFVPIMRLQKTGHILNIASAAAFVAAPRMSAYSSSKAGVVALSESLRSELVDDGVVVSVLMPTYVRTNIGRDSLGSIADNQLAQQLVEQSQLTAETVAAVTLQKMNAGALYVVLPAEAEFLWRFKRFMPERFWRFIAREATRRVALLQKDSTLR
ncbi:MAG: SDR family NAD(P)-dependent oxidoreductase [Candidatus Melainabacteria bacterium]|nr:SDR family NAD(P)-dependent oxidoreductase [Candidatus Melainabacteria bacterium]